jgi:SAM-dependent methyltransferase
LAPTEHFDDPVKAYSRLAPHYQDLSRGRERYLCSVEKIIVSRVPPNSTSLLDIGAGDGRRTLRIARDGGIQRVVVVEPSPEMASPVEGSAETWKIRAEDLGAYIAHAGALRNQQNNTENSASFDVVTCLWNVLGHVRGFENRVRAMRAMGDHLAPDGKCFLDVNHRYNFRSYGAIASAARFIRDSAFYKESNADVIPTWDLGARSISTHGHAFTDREVRQLASAAGLIVEDRIVVDYDSGKIRRFAFEGNLLYVFRRSSRIDSSRAPHTS